MSFVTETIMDSISGEAIDSLSTSLDLPQEKTKSTVAAAIPLLIRALNKNTDEGGAMALSSALTEDHDGSILGKVTQFLGSGDFSGSGILKHVLGNRLDGIAKTLAEMSGLETETVTKLLAAIAPIVLGALGKRQKADSLDAGGLSDLLTREEEYVREKSPEGLDFLSRILDTDGDGSSVDDLAGIGSQLLGSFLK